MAIRGRRSGGSGTDSGNLDVNINVTANFVDEGLDRAVSDMNPEQRLLRSVTYC